MHRSSNKSQKCFTIVHSLHQVRETFAFFSIMKTKTAYFLIVAKKIEKMRIAIDKSLSLCYNLRTVLILKKGNSPCKKKSTKPRASRP